MASGIPILASYSISRCILDDVICFSTFWLGWQNKYLTIFWHLEESAFHFVYQLLKYYVFKFSVSLLITKFSVCCVLLTYLLVLQFLMHCSINPLLLFCQCRILGQFFHWEFHRFHFQNLGMLFHYHHYLSNHY